MTSTNTAAPQNPASQPEASQPRFTAEQQAQIDKGNHIEHWMNLIAMMLIVAPSAFGLFFLLMDGWVGLVRAVLCLVVSVLIARICLKKVEAVPKQVGVRTWFGARLPLLKKEGWNLVIPGIWDLVRVDVTDKNTDLSQKKVKTKDGQVDVDASTTWHPNYDDAFDMIRYIDVGGAEGVEDIIDDPTSQGIRQHATELETDKAPADKEGFRESIIESLIHTEDQALIERFKNGETHLIVKNVGIKIVQLTVPDVALPDDIAEATRKRAIEKEQKKSETTERDFTIKSIQKISEKTGLTPAESKELWLVERGKVRKDVHEEQFHVTGETTGDPLGIMKAAQIFSAGARRSGQGQGGKSKKEE